MAESGPISLWDSTAAEPVPPSPPDMFGQVEGSVADVAIVGGGFTGLSTALHCALKGLSAQVLEAGEIGQGGSGRNVGLVNAGIWLPPGKVKAALGEPFGPRFLERFADAPRRVFDLIEKYQIRCEPTRAGTIHAAHAPAGLRDLRGRHAEWAKMGAPVEMLSRSEMAERTGSRAFAGGLLDRRAGTINPMGYCRGLARAAVAAGARIATGVTVTGLRRDGAAWRVKTDAGTLSATHVVLGTNAYTDALWPGLSKTYTTIHFFQFATAPLGEEAAHVLPGRQGLWDTAPIMTSLRRDAEGRLILGSMGRVLGTAGRGISRRWAEARLRQLYPELAGVGFEEAWHGRIAMTPDHLPRIHRLAEGLWTPIGYNGRGITTGTLFGEAVAGLLTGADPADLPLPLTDAAPVRGGALTTRLHDAAFTLNQLWQGLR